VVQAVVHLAKAVLVVNQAKADLVKIRGVATKPITRIGGVTLDQQAAMEARAAKDVTVLKV
jgi:hypothetical protein